jgi:hypothetical protein
MGYKFLITLPKRFVPDAQLCNDPAPYGSAHAWIMPDASANTLLDLLCDPLLFRDSRRVFVTTKNLFSPGRRNRTERSSNDLEDLFNLVWG